MSVSRRDFLHGLGRTTRSAELMAARGHERSLGERVPQGGRSTMPRPPARGDVIRLNLNENPLGPGKAAMDALLGRFPEANRYPFTSSPLDADLEMLLARVHDGKRENIVLGAGSQEILRNAVRVFMSPTRHLVEALPTYGNCSNQARHFGWTIKTAPVDAALRTDLAALLPLVKGAGLVYLSNPNNPTATAVSGQAIGDFVTEVHQVSPTTAIVVDEAYSDYAGASFSSVIALALATPNVLVAKTFSKAYGMAGVRVGYGIGQAETVRKMSKYRTPYGVNTFGVAAAMASLNDPAHIKQEAVRNLAVREFTIKAFADLGYTSTESQGNFIFTNIGKAMTAAAFRDACAARNVIVGRDFPPLEKQWTRISLGTMEEMQRATDVFRAVLKAATMTASAKGQ